MTSETQPTSETEPTFEAELRDRLHDAAGRLAGSGDDGASADAVIDRRAVERRRRAVGAVAAACLVAVLVVLVPLLGAGAGSSHGAPASGGSPTPAATSGSEPVHGSLASDDAYLEAVRLRDWPVPLWAPAVDDRRVAFAGDEQGTRWVLVTGPADGMLLGQWFTGPAGTPAADLEAGGAEQIPVPGIPVAAARSDDTGTTSLLLCRAGDEVEFSAGVEVVADGRTERRWTAVPCSDGAAVWSEGPARAAAGLLYRVERAGVLLRTAAPTGAGVDDAGDVPATGAPLRPGSGTPDPAAVRAALRPVLDATGLRAADVGVRALWTGTLPGPVDTSARVVVLAVTFPSGGVVTSTGFASDGATGAAADDGAVSGFCGAAAHPAGTRPEDLVVAARCEALASTGITRSILVTAPPAADRVQLSSPDGVLLADPPLDGGSAVLPDPGTVASVRVSGPAFPGTEAAPTADPGGGSAFEDD